jgi:serine/threonine-protein kinase RsbW/stage II sporulation protein AB (anti-sigma F factor)
MGEEVTAPQHRLDVAVPAEAIRLAEVRAAVRQFLDRVGAAEPEQQSVVLAVSEAANNVVTHAYRDRDVAGELRVQAHVEADRLAVLVADDGQGVAPRPDSPGAGLGMPLMATLAESLSVTHTDSGGTCVILNFVLGRAAN